MVALEDNGFDVLQPPAGASDQEIGELAESEQRVIITFDKHFATPWLFPPEQYFGIIFIRIRPPVIEAALYSLLNLFNSVAAGDFQGKLFVVGADGFKTFPKK